jgi:hypothetical protein
MIDEALIFARKPEVPSLTTPIQSAKENPRIEFRDGQFVFCMTNEAGGLVERFISAAQVRQAFTGIPIESGWLPPGVMRWGNGIRGEWAVGFIPPRVHELELTREVATAPGADPTAGTPVPPLASEIDRIRVPLPGLVWFGIATSYWIWAVKTETLQPYQEIYRAPLPNIYADGSICWGLVKPERMTAKTLFKAYDLFMGTTFNNHLANAKSKSKRDDVRVMLRDLARAAAEFPAMVPVAEMEADFEPGQFVSPLPEIELIGPSYPIDDLMRQVDRVGVTLDQAISSYFETGVIPS